VSKLQRVRHEFVDSIPEHMDEGVVYVCIPFAMVGHKCCCGCGNEVFTPLAPHRWRVTYDGETVSLADSIGNWSFPCQSHYWIIENEVRWSGKWTRQQIESGRTRTRDLIGASASPAFVPKPDDTKRSLIARLLRRAGRDRSS
jgi:hypothetical protein